MATVMARGRPASAVASEEETLKKKGYITGPQIGEGSYAKVRSAYSEKHGKRVALKIISRKKAPKDFQLKFLPRELEIMKVVKHPQIVELYEIMQFDGKIVFVMEMAGHGDLLEFIKLRGALDEVKARLLFGQLVDAMAYCHSLDIVHRDLKCENLLLDSQTSLKVTDFGFARYINGGDLSRTFCGSAAYAAPEILQGIPYNAKVYDIWSMGVVLYIMVSGSMPYDDSNLKKMIKDQTQKKLGFSRSKNLSSEIKELISGMLCSDVEKRLSIPQIRNSAWMQMPVGEMSQKYDKQSKRSAPQPPSIGADEQSIVDAMGKVKT